ncbi:WXG100 family type VII secretion target [Actinoplanes sp. CA-054009]
MSENERDLWVRPEAVKQLGNVYAAHAAMYDQYLIQLQALRSQYGNSWGNDDMGNEFSARFLSGMDNLENLIGSVKGGLEYTASGLRESGDAYREADDEAKRATHKFANAFHNLSANPGGGGGGGIAPDISSSARPASEGGSATASLRTGESDTPPPATARDGETDATPVRAAVTAAAPRVAFDPATHTNLLVDGKTAPEGYRVTALTAQPDGTVSFDANQYEAVAPLGFTPVTDAHGEAVEPGDDKRFFLVKDAPQAATGREPMYVSIPVDGARR